MPSLFPRKEANFAKLNIHVVTSDAFLAFSEIGKPFQIEYNGNNVVVSRPLSKLCF